MAFGRGMGAGVSLGALMLAGALLAGCDGATGGANGAASTTPRYGTFGFDTAGMDRNVSPGDDFYSYANGAWTRNTEIPADRSGLSTFTVINIELQDKLKSLLETASTKRGATGDEKRVGDYFAAFMDEAGIERRGLAPVQPNLAAIAGIADKAALSRFLGQSLRADVDLLNATDLYTDRLFGLWVTQDLADPTKVVPYMVQGGLGMPDRDYYLDGSARMAELRTKYRQHVEHVLTLGGQADAAAKAERILALETAMARSHWTAADNNDIAKGNNHWTQADFATRAPGIDWVAWRDGAGLASQQDWVVWEPSAVSGLSALVASQPLDVWKAYLTFHALDRASAYLPKAFSDENFAFYGTALAGTPQQADRWKRALNSANADIGEAVGKLYVDRYFPASSKATAQAMVQNILRAFGRRIDGLEWMTAETKRRAHAKLDALKVDIGYPDHWRDYSGVEIRRDDPFGNAERASMANYRHALSRLGRPVSHDEWYMLPQDVNAVNLPLENRLLFPAAILNAPFFDPNADAAVNYGAVGGVIGHEISHSFDSIGALIDETGKVSNWWTPQDFSRFQSATRALVLQYDDYAPFPDLHLRGQQTLSENVADVAGLSAAFDGYHLSLNGQQAPVIDGFTGDQRFFLGWAQNYRSKFREPAMRQRVLTDVHSPGQYRAAAVRNLDGWYTAFNVQPNERLYLAPDKRVRIW